VNITRNKLTGFIVVLEDNALRWHTNIVQRQRDPMPASQSSRLPQMNIDQERTIFRQELGHALNEWAEVESSVRYAALTVVNTDQQRNALSIGYVSIQGFASKLAFANWTIARFFVGSPLAAEWEMLFKRADAACAKRNRLAHWTTREYLHAQAGRRVLLIPWRYNKPKPRKPGAQKPPPEGSLGVRAIVECRLEFTALSNAILNWAFRASGKQEPFTKAEEKAGRAPAIAGLLKQAQTVFK
jgi:hypothetical protein